MSESANILTTDAVNRVPLSWDQLQSVKAFISGGMGSVAAKTVTAPFSRVTILMQIQSTNLRRKKSMELFKEILREDGFLAFWRGNLASCLHRFPYSGITFLVQDMSSRGLSESSKFPKAAVDFTSGALGGGVAACLTYPLDVVRFRLSAQTGPRPEYCGICNVISRIAVEQGTQGFYRGLFPTLLHVVPSFAINFQVFGSLKERYRSTHDSGASNDKGTIPVKEAFLYGCGAGFFSSALLFPIDLVRRQMQAERFLGIREVVKAVYRNNGVRGFYNGLPSELIKVVPFVGIMFMSVEYLKKLDWPLEPHFRQRKSLL